MTLRHLLFLTAIATACGSDDPATTAETTAPDAAGAETTSKTPTEFKFKDEMLQTSTEEIALVPSPAEMQRALTNLGLNSKLSEMVAYRDIKMDSDNNDQIAVRTGVVIAELVLTVQDAPKEMLINRLNRLNEGFTKLEAGEDITGVVERLVTKVTNDAITREDLVKEMDQLAGVLVPEIRDEAGAQVVPLIQAGAWLEGAHLVSGAIDAEQKHEQAASLLRQPVVVAYFKRYVEREGSDKATDAVLTELRATLTVLGEISDKETMTEEDVKTIHSVTGAVLKLL